MTNDIIQGIADALNDTFGSGYSVYKEDIPQGFEEPCFSIVHIMSENSGKLPVRYHRRNRFDVHYFPKDERNAKTEMYSVAESLFLALEYINVLDNSCRGTKMSYEIIDGVLHFLVNYDLYITKNIEESQSSMQTLQYTPTLEENNG